MNFLFVCFVFSSYAGSSLRHAGFSPVAGGGSSLVVARGLLIAVASLIVEHGLLALGFQ